jgi:hypothetical protein
MDEVNFASDSNEPVHYGSMWLAKNDNENLNYQLDYDHDPIVIRKKAKEKIVQTQYVSLRYLRPPSLPSPGDIIVKEDPEKLATPLPPLVIRRHFPKPPTPEPLTYREGIFF